MGEFSVGQPVPRTEDPRLLTGGGRYVDDLTLTNVCQAHILRSPHAHAAITNIDTTRARQAPGVLAILTGEDYMTSGLGNMRCAVSKQGRDGSEMYRPPRPALTGDRVRFVGDAIAMIIAETRSQARDAAELITVDYDALPAITNTAASFEAGSALVWDACARNECFLHLGGDADATEAGITAASRVIKKRFVINRVAANTMEPRGAVGDYDRRDGRYTIHTALHYPHRLRRQLADEIFGVPEADIRVVARDIGGSFGLRGGMYPEQILVMWASKIVERPVKWLADRSEGFISDCHGRDNVTDAELALDDNGKFLALRVRTLVNMGAYLAEMGPGPAVNNLGTLAGPYTTPAISVEVSGVFTNMNPTCPYRGAGRPEAAYVIEQLIDAAARETGISGIELRRRNTIPPDAMPFKTGLTFIYDCGEFEKNMDDALKMADFDGFEARRQDANSRGRLRGIGVSNTVERGGGGGSQERAEIRFDATGGATIIAGTISQGQGHDTVYKQIAADVLGISPNLVRVVEGDTDTLPIGGGTGGSRSATAGGSAVLLAARKIADKGKRIAAHLLEAAIADIELIDGKFGVAGTDRSVTLNEVARAAYTPGQLPAEIEPGLDEAVGFAPPVSNYPNGCHVCELEIDPDTGVVEFMSYDVVDDVGTVLNPLLLKGQIQGGVAQGLGQALMEDMVHDPVSGQPVTASFLDYAMPRADDMCAINVSSNPVPTATNPLGVKGAGEAGTVGALPAVVSAVVNALSPLGIEDIPMPATPERIWRAIQGANP